MRTACLLGASLALAGAVTNTVINPVTGASTNTLQIEATPGDPHDMSVVIINTAAPR